MEVVLTLADQFHFHVRTHNNIEFSVDAHAAEPKGPAPMQLLLASVPACAAMDIVSILRKQRIEIAAFTAHARAERASEHPRVFTTMHLHFALTSPDAEPHHLERAISLSEQKYCSAWAMVRASGCSVTWSYEIIRPSSSSSSLQWES
ncbi:MAG: OsmC family protein [Bacteroidota bacterium]|nr:OsmC family protein [Candidatus Kapabacteria bacterium]MCS7302545.1 OsmC family protein [Candidatus Kapabacteria bacterium]MCX7936769.1 OsmC family protein [Chlorobiota bacterium]MDW8074187.1 OsmC family protein [Bacteroidota bacterium]MDW8271337.1 OsmC family protein [Bacteroidota bacterium]